MGGSYQHRMSCIQPSIPSKVSWQDILWVAQWEEAGRLILLGIWFKCYIYKKRQHLGKFQRRCDIGFLVGYSSKSKAYRVFYYVIGLVEETYDVEFDESTLLIRLVVVKWEFMLVTLGDRHHLDGLVVIGSLVIIRRDCGWPNSSYERLWVIHRDGVSKNQHVESTWSLRGSRESYTLARVLQRGLVGSDDSPIPQQNIAAFPLLSLLWAFTWSISILVIYIPRIAMLK